MLSADDSMPTLIAIAIFLGACLALYAGQRLAARLPQSHLVGEMRSAAQVGIGMLATLAALVLGLMITSAKGSFDDRDHEIVEVATASVLLDRALAGYGDGARSARAELKAMASEIASRINAGGNVTEAEFRVPLRTVASLTHLQETILALTPATDAQRWFQQRALTLSSEIGRLRVLTVERGDHTVPNTLLVVIAAWVILIFFGLGVFVAANRTITGTLVVCAFAFATAVLLVLELDTPYSGIIGISGRPLANALAELGG
jgi:hypothetical protein